MAEETQNDSNLFVTCRAFDPEDTPDAKSWAQNLVDDMTPPSVAKMPVGRDDDEYNMNHKYRGKAIIFNHKDFTVPGLNSRHGTDVDRDNLKTVLTQLDFDVEVYDDLPFKLLERKISSLAEEDHSDRDCLLIAVFSHGIPNRIYARDMDYKSDLLWDSFTAENCPTLAGKPKIFFIQACQGDQVDGGVIMRSLKGYGTQTDSAPKSEAYKIPTRADFLMVFSAFPGYYSWRNTREGSWFVQSTCQALRKYGHHKELLAIVTIISRQVALNYESFVPNKAELDQKKQVPYVTSTLIREVYFRPKSDTGESIEPIITVEEPKKGFAAFKSLVRPSSTKSPSEVRIIPDNITQPVVPVDQRQDDLPLATAKMSVVNPKTSK